MGQSSAKDYRCLATMEVPADKVDLYDQLLCKAASVFTKHGWRLLVPAQKASIYDATGTPPGLLRKLLHLWQIPDFDSLTAVMASAADDEAYVQAQALTTVEAQDLYTALRWDSPIGLPDTPVKFYMMETLHVIKNVQVREDFANYMDYAVYTTNERYGWKIMFAGNATTGVLDEYVQIWGMADITKLDAAIVEYRSEPRWKDAVTKVTTSMWTPRPLPCLGEPGMPHPSAGGVSSAGGTSGGGSGTSGSGASGG